MAELVACVTTWFTSEEELPKLLVSPTYTAVKGYVSALRLVLVSMATPLLFKVAEPMV